MEISPEDLIVNEETPFSENQTPSLQSSQNTELTSKTKSTVKEVAMQTELGPIAHEANYVQKDTMANRYKNVPKIKEKQLPVVRKSSGNVKKATKKEQQPSTTSPFIYLALLALLCGYVYLPLGDHLPAVSIPFFSNTAVSPFSNTPSPLRYKGTAYELWTTPHNTRSDLIDYRMAEARRLFRVLQTVFADHLRQNTGLACLCMHHLHLDRALPEGKDISHLKLYQVCGVKNRRNDQLYMLVNPKLGGGSNATKVYSENSVSCESDQFQSRKRRQQVFIDWIDPETSDMMYYKFKGVDAACLQLALDEFKGDAHCK